MGYGIICCYCIRTKKKKSSTRRTRRHKMKSIFKCRYSWWRGSINAYDTESRSSSTRSKTSMNYWGTYCCTRKERKETEKVGMNLSTIHKSYIGASCISHWILCSMHLVLYIIVHEVVTMMRGYLAGVEFVLGIFLFGVVYLRMVRGV